LYAGKKQHARYEFVTNIVLPPRIWICPACQSQFVEGWRLKRHLVLTHELSETKAWSVTDLSEYWLRVRSSEQAVAGEFGVDAASPRPDGRRRNKRS
jgi:hypothetical protein